jgi:succinyl-CoA synthetase alpha subunit
MSILVNKDTRILVQGITGKTGLFHTGLMKEYGTPVVAGVTPGKGNTDVEGTPVFDTVAQAREKTGANASVIFVPPPFAADSILEAADAGIELIVTITEGIPAMDMARVMDVLRHKRGVRLVGPNCPGIITPGIAKLGIMPGNIHQPGHVGVVSRSGTLTYMAVNQLTRLGLGQSTALGIGGDPIIGSSFIDILSLFEADPETEAVVMIGEIGGDMEERAAEYVRDNMTKPVTAFIAGQTAPPGKRMGHAGAIISGGKGTAAAKIEKLESCGIRVARLPVEIGRNMAEALGHKA